MMPRVANVLSSEVKAAPLEREPLTVGRTTGVAPKKPSFWVDVVPNLVPVVVPTAKFNPSEKPTLVLLSLNDEAVAALLATSTKSPWLRSVTSVLPDMLYNAPFSAPLFLRRTIVFAGLLLSMVNASPLAAVMVTVPKLVALKRDVPLF